MRTAVEWFGKKVLNVITTDEFNNLLEQAKEMEKQQIISVIKLVIEKEYHEQNWSKCESINYVAENYYNENFKNNENENR